MWPTPTLEQTIKTWPTPTATERSGINPNTGKGAGLWKKVQQWPTPHARCYSGIGEHGQGGQNLQTVAGGKLNPDWVEWLMGVPFGWTSLKPLSKEAVADWLNKTLASEWWKVEPDIPRITDQKENRVSRLKTLGNGIVPVVARQILI